MRAPLPLLLALAGCAAGVPHAEPARQPPVRHWGAMREVLREGRTEGRVALADVVGPDTVAVGALEGLAAEVTVVQGVVHLTEVVDAASRDGVRTRPAGAGDRATLLVAADVARWDELDLGAVADLAELEARVRDAVHARGHVPGPVPFRVEGVARSVALHVLDHSCPIAHPDGPQPWRHAAADEPVALVGFFAEDAGGVLTHDGQATHTHVLLSSPGVSGHLDEVAFADGARLFLPRR